MASDHANVNGFTRTQYWRGTAIAAHTSGDVGDHRVLLEFSLQTGVSGILCAGRVDD
jgi:hypothetical protein